MKIVKFEAIIMEFMKTIRISLKNYENHENHIISTNNYENHDNPRISREHNEQN